MRKAKSLSLITGSVAIISFISTIAFYFLNIGLLYDLSLALFGSALLSFFMSISEYITVRREAREAFYIAASDVRNKLSSIKPVVLKEPKELLFDALSEYITNKHFDEAEESEKCFLPPKSNSAETEYLKWHLSSDEVDIPLTDELKENFHKQFEKIMQQRIKTFEQAFQMYMDLSILDHTELDDAFSNLCFLRNNEEKLTFIYDMIYKKLIDSLGEIAKQSYHFRLYLDGQGNFFACADLILQLNDFFFEKVPFIEEDRKTISLYRTELDEIQDRLAVFLGETYQNKQSYRIEHHPCYVVQYADDIKKTSNNN